MGNCCKSQSKVETSSKTIKEVEEIRKIFYQIALLTTNPPLIEMLKKTLDEKSINQNSIKLKDQINFNEPTIVIIEKRNRALDDIDSDILVKLQQSKFTYLIMDVILI